MDFKLPNNPKISALYGSPALNIGIVAFAIYLPSLFFSGFLKALFIVVAAFVLFMALSNIYVRFKSDWARIHYPVSLMYLKTVVFIMNKYPEMPMEDRVFLAFKLVLGKLYPSLSDLELEAVVDEINNDNILTNRKNIYGLFKYRGIEEKDLEQVTDTTVKRYKLDEPETADKLQITNFYSHIIGAKYGENAVYEYMLAMFNNKVT